MSDNVFEAINYFVCPFCGQQKLRPKWQRDQRLKEWAKQKANEAVDAVMTEPEKHEEETQEEG